MDAYAFRRDLGEFQQQFDVAVVGAGVQGACIARLLAMRGLKVALVERDDFGAGTSRNCAKLLHGGFRYVQHLDAKRIRESMRAQRAWLSAVPHLVRPLRCMVPAYGHGTRGPLALAGGMCAFHLFAWDRNLKVPRAVQLPRSGLIGRSSLVQSWPQLERPDVTGAAWWYDAQMLDASRMVLEFLLDARQRGAVIANHVECTGLRQAGNRVEGLLARDTLTGKEFEVAARMTVNAAGPWSSDVAADLPGLDRQVPLSWTRNMNLVTRPVFPGSTAFGVGSNQSSDARVGRSKRLFFVSPWQGCSVIGTTHEAFKGDPDSVNASEGDLATFLAEINESLPTAKLNAGDVRSVHVGLTPAEDGTAGRAKRSFVVDHHAHGVAGVITAIAIKYTTAPEVAEAVTAIACDRLGRAGFAAHLSQPVAAAGSLAGQASGTDYDSPDPDDASQQAWARRIYGSSYGEMIGAVPTGALSVGEHVFRCRVVHGVRSEMVSTLTGALLRATDEAERGCLSEAHIQWCAETLSEEHQWTAQRKERELVELRDCLQRMHSRVAPVATDVAA